jgi:uncharacterized glyoxalase superfamily protein PhnB
MAIQAKSATVLYQVFDMRESVAFYRDVLGFEVLGTHEPDGHLCWAMLKLGGASLMLNAKHEDEERPPAPEPTKGHEDITLYIVCENVDQTYAELREKIQLDPPVNTYYGMRQIFVMDPDGFQICFQEPVKN